VREFVDAVAGPVARGVAGGAAEADAEAEADGVGEEGGRVLRLAAGVLGRLPGTAPADAPPCALALSGGPLAARTSSGPPFAPPGRKEGRPGSKPLETATVPRATAAETPSKPVRTGLAARRVRWPRPARSSACCVPGPCPGAWMPWVSVVSVARSVVARPAAERRWRPMSWPSPSQRRRHAHWAVAINRTHSIE
jgi:hypothetical protein